MKISRLNREPSDNVSFDKWIAAKDQLDFLNSNARSDELILYAAGTKFFVHGVAIRRDLLFPLDKDDLVEWSGNPYSSRAGYNSGSHDPEIWISEGCLLHGSKTLKKCTTVGVYACL